MEVSVTSGFGAYANYPRGSVGEGLQAVHMSAAPYRLANFRGRARGYFQNKAPSGVLRAVGQPDRLHGDRAAASIWPREGSTSIRRSCGAATMRAAGEVTARSAGGIVLAELSLERCHDRLLALMDYDRLRREQAEAPQRAESIAASGLPSSSSRLLSDLRSMARSRCASRRTRHAG